VKLTPLHFSLEGGLQIRQMSRRNGSSRRLHYRLHSNRRRVAPGWYRRADLSVAMVIVVAGLAFEARIAAGAGTRVICSGDGRALATSLECAIASDCRGLISFGVAGGLSPQLGAGTYVVGSAILSETAQFTTDLDWSRGLLQTIPGSVYGLIAGVSAPIAHPEAKRALHINTGALAVDMESHVVADVAAARGLPMVAVRVITDSAMCALPRAALTAMRTDGTIDMAAVVRSMVKEPGELPILLRTALDALVGLAALFRGRQLLGPHFALPY
jgi:hopanoid-associated phosphorylase